MHDQGQTNTSLGLGPLASLASFARYGITYCYLLDLEYTDAYYRKPHVINV